MFYVFIFLFVHSFGTVARCFYLSICLPFARIHISVLFIFKKIFLQKYRSSTKSKKTFVDSENIISFQSWLLVVCHSIATKTENSVSEKYHTQSKEYPLNKCQCEKELKKQIDAMISIFSRISWYLWKDSCWCQVMTLSTKYTQKKRLMNTGLQVPINKITIRIYVKVKLSSFKKWDYLIFQHIYHKMEHLIE